MDCLLYPYYDDLYTIIKNLNKYDPGLNITVAVYPRAWKKSIVNTADIKETVLACDFKEKLPLVECVIISDVSDKEYMYSDIISKIRMALDNNKEVIICTEIADDDVKKLKMDYPEGAIKILYDCSSGFRYNSVSYQHQECVAIGVGPLYRGIDNTVAITNLTNEFTKLGYKVCSVTANETCRLLGFYSFPKKIFSGFTDIEEIVEKLNEYLIYLEKITKCDIMIIQFPDGVAKYSDYTNDSYGVKAFILSRAVAFDYFLLVSLFDTIGSEQFSKAKRSIEQNFNFTVDSCAVKPVSIRYEFNPEFREYSFTKENIEKYESETDQLIASSDDVIIRIDDAAAYKLIVDHCINKLS